MFLRCLFLVVLFAGLISSCAPEVPEAQRQVTEFFDLSKYFEGQIEDWTGKTVKKTISLNEKEETLNQSNLDFAAEFQLFKQADINKSALLDKYQVDTTFNDSKHSTVSYQAISKKLGTQNLALHFTDEELTGIMIKRRVKNLLFQTNQELIYLPGKSYSIETEQTVRFFQPKKSSISVESL